MNRGAIPLQSKRKGPYRFSSTLWGGLQGKRKALPCRLPSIKTPQGRHQHHLFICINAALAAR